MHEQILSAKFGNNRLCASKISRLLMWPCIEQVYSRINWNSLSELNLILSLLLILILSDIRAESVLILELFALKYLDVLQGRIDNEKVSLTRSNTRSITPLMSGNFNQSRNNSFSNINPNKNRNGNNNNNNNNYNNNINYGYNDTRASWTNTFRRDWAAAERSDQSSNETDDFNQRGRFAYRMNDSSNWHNNNNSSSNSYLNNDYNRNNNLHNNSYDDTYNNGNYNNSFNNVNRIHESNLLAQRLEFFTQQFTSMSTASRYPSKRKSNNFN